MMSTQIQRQGGHSEPLNPLAQSFQPGTGQSGISSQPSQLQQGGVTQTRLAASQGSTAVQQNASQQGGLIPPPPQAPQQLKRNEANLLYSLMRRRGKALEDLLSTIRTKLRSVAESEVPSLIISRV